MKNRWPAHKDQLLRYIAKRVADAAVAEDIFHDVYLKAHTNIHTLKSEKSLTAWLYRVTANAVADHYRNRQPWVKLPDEIPEPQTEPDVTGELAVCLQPLLAELPETYRTALELSELEGLSQKEVASRLELSYSATKSRIRRGKKKLKELFLECCEIECQQGQITGYERTKKSDKYCQKPCE